MLFVTNNEHGLADERVKGVGDHHLKRQTPGIMNPLRGKAAWAGKQSTDAPASIRRGIGHGTLER
jgi:hypothetical protein